MDTSPVGPEPVEGPSVHQFKDVVLLAITVALTVLDVLATNTGDARAQSAVPEKPTGLTASSVSHDSVTLTWDAPGDDSITGYRILRRDRDNDEPGVFAAINADTGTADTEYVDESVLPEHRYVYRVAALNTEGLSPRSSYVNVDTPAQARRFRWWPQR